MTGAITGYIDVAQLTLYAFWIFFAGLIFYLRREDKREGYPLKSDRSEHVSVQGFPPLPTPKTFLLHNGGTVQAPRGELPEAVLARPAEPWPGAPLIPTGNPMIDGVGPCAYADRSDVPEMMFENEHETRIVPLRQAPEYFFALEDPEPIGMEVFGLDRARAGVVTDGWIDRSEMLLRYLEVAVDTTAGLRSVLLPMNLTKVNRKARRILVRSITAAQFATVPGLRNPDQVTALEEDKIMAYYGGGNLYATPRRQEPLL
jgi:photosynthetic reaction center H subunit